MAVRVRWWEVSLLVVPTLLSVLFFAGGQVAAGAVLLALVVVVLASRAQIAERNIAGGYARTRGWLQLTRAFALFAIYLVVVALFFVIRRDHWTRDTHGTVAMWALTGFAFYLLRHIWQTGDDANRWLLGGDLEAEVARLLEPLRAEGWLITHDIRKDYGGNVDHFITGPRGSFVIETKRGKNRASARNQAISNAVWAKEKFSQRWVTAILCVSTDPPTSPEQQGHAWVMGPKQLASFIRSGAAS